MWATSQFSKLPGRVLAHFLSFYSDQKKKIGEKAGDFTEIKKKLLDEQTRSFYYLFHRTFTLQCFFWSAGLISNRFIILPTKLNMTVTGSSEGCFYFDKVRSSEENYFFLKKALPMNFVQGKYS